MPSLEHSKIYTGWVRHQRRVDGQHAFRYPLSLVLVDLDEWDALQDLLPLHGSRFAPRSLRRTDYLDAESHATATPDHATPDLATAVRDRVEGQLGFRPGGRIQMLTQLRSFGYLFNPVTFYLCRDDAGGVEAVVAEITNTPWGQRHAYVLDGRDGSRSATQSWTFEKTFHVSPFHGMDHLYRWRLHLGGDRLTVTMQNERDKRCVFDVVMNGRLSALNAKSLRRSIWRRPFQSQRLHVAIYWQALRLYRKKATFHPNPRRAKPALTAR